jgi:hypothetical protein
VVLSFRLSQVCSFAKLAVKRIAGRTRVARKFSGYGVVSYFSEREKFTAAFSSALTVTFFSQVLGSEKIGR